MSGFEVEDPALGGQLQPVGPFSGRPSEPQLHVYTTVGELKQLYDYTEVSKITETLVIICQLILKYFPNVSKPTWFCCSFFSKRGVFFVLREQEREQLLFPFSLGTPLQKERAASLVITHETLGWASSPGLTRRRGLD